MKILKWTFFSLVTIAMWSCNESSSNERFIVNSSQKTILLRRGYDSNNIYLTYEILPGDTINLDYQGTNGKWDMKNPMYDDYLYYYDSTFLSVVANGLKLNKDIYNYDEWTSYLTDATALPSYYYFTSYFTIRDSDITP